MIDIKGVSKTFGETTALNAIDLSVKKGETMVLIGPSGCGKTTLLKLINKLQSPDDGIILVDNKNIKSLNSIELRRGMGYVVQEVGLFPHLSLYDNIALIPRVLKMGEGSIQEKIDELRVLLNIENIDLKGKYRDEISGGQRQRIGIARALVTDPDIILLDEPFGALDPITRIHIRKEFRKLENIINKTMVMITHDVAEALDIADRICIMNQGRVEQTGTAGELLFNPASDFVSDFFLQDLLKHQMSSVTIADILPFLPVKDMEAGSAMEIQPEENIFSVLNHHFHQRKTYFVTDREQYRHYLSPEILMKAFTDYIMDKQGSLYD